MAVPKRKTSKARRDKRRAHDALAIKNVINCPQCGEMALPHRACSACGFYKGKQVIVASEELE